MVRNKVLQNIQAVAEAYKTLGVSGAALRALASAENPTAAKFIASRAMRVLYYQELAQEVANDIADEIDGQVASQAGNED